MQKKSVALVSKRKLDSLSPFPIINVIRNIKQCLTFVLFLLCSLSLSPYRCFGLWIVCNIFFQRLLQQWLFCIVCHTFFDNSNASSFGLFRLVASRVEARNCQIQIDAQHNRYHGPNILAMELRCMVAGYHFVCLVEKWNLVR